MTSPLDKIKSAVLGVPVDPNKKPSKTGVVQAFAEMQEMLEGAQAGAIVKATRAALYALTTAPSAGCMAWVTNDSTIGYNGIYENTGTVNAPVWTRRTDIPQFFISCINSGAGTANAIQVTTDLPVPSADGRCLIALPIVATNTSSTVTVSINGGTPLTIVRNYGTPLAVGDLVNGVFYLGVIAGGQFKLINPARDVVETLPGDGTITDKKLENGLIQSYISEINITKLGLTGVGDETTKLNNAITTANGKWINFEGKTINVNSAIVTSKPCRFKNGVLNLTTESATLSPQGVAGTAFVPSSALAAGASTIPFAASTGIAAGRLIFIISDDVWSSTLELGGAGQGGVRSQWARVKSLSGNNLVLANALDYAFSTNVKVYAPAMIDGCAFENFTFKGLGANNYQKLFTPYYCSGITYYPGVAFEDTGHSGVEHFRCYGIRGYGTRHDRAFGTGLSYGMVMDAGCEDVIFFGIRGSDLRHIVTSGGTAGVNRHIRVYGAHVIGARDALVDTHFPSDLCEYHGIFGSMAPGTTQEAVQMEGSRIRVTGVNVTNASGAVRWQPFTDMVDDWCELEGALSGFQTGSTQPAFSIDNRKGAGNIRFASIRGVGIQVAGGYGVFVTNPSATNIENLRIDGNFKSSGVTVTIQTTSTGTIKNVVIDGVSENTGTSVENIYIYASTPGKVDDVEIRARVIGGQYGVRNVSDSVNNVRVLSTAQMLSQPSGQMFLGKVGCTQKQGCLTIASDATATLTSGVDAPEILHTGTLTANRDLSLSALNVFDGAKFRIVRTGGGAFTLSARIAGGGAVLKSLSTNQWCEVVYSSTAGAWRLAAYGTL